MLSTKKTCFFIGVCSVKVFYTVSAKKTPTGVGKAGKPFQVQSIVFKRSLRQVQETDRTGSIEATMTVYKLGQLGGEFPRKKYPPKVGISMIKSPFNKSKFKFYHELVHKDVSIIWVVPLPSNSGSHEGFFRRDPRA